MEIIDAQIHPVDPLTTWSFEMSKAQLHEVSAELAVSAMDAAGVSAALVNTIDRRLMATYHARYPTRFRGVLATGPQFVHEGTPLEYIKEAQERCGLAGLRLLPWYPQEQPSIALFREGKHRPYCEAARECDLSIFVFAPNYLGELDDMFLEFGDVRFVIDHVGLEAPPLVPVTEALFDAVDVVAGLARFPNVALKFSGAPALSAEGYPFADLWDRLRPILSAFGTERLLWGSDFTRCRELHNYRESVDFLMFSEQFDEATKKRIFSENLRTWVPAARGLGAE